MRRSTPRYMADNDLPPDAGYSSHSDLPSAGNLAALDLVSVRLMVLCAEEGALVRAAKRANLSLSGASHRLASMEGRLGCRLFLRHHRGLLATPPAEALLPLAARLLREASAFQEACARVSPEEKGATA